MCALKRILIISPDQYGYIDYFSIYSKYLSEKYIVDYWCFDEKKPKIDYIGNNITYYEKPDNKFRLLSLVFKMGFMLRNSNYTHIIYRGTKFSFLIKLISGKKGIYDIRSVGVSANYYSRFIQNSWLRFNSLFFENIFIISPSIAKRLRINPAKVSIIPLGAEIDIERSNSPITEMKFLYVGTLSERRIHDTIVGLSMFCKANSNVNINYTIIGTGDDTAMNKIDIAMKSTPANLNVCLKGYVPSSEINKYYVENNIGISYVPITKWYLLQPPTKTYEYLVAGMVVIATALPANIEVINDTNGIIINDDEEFFRQGVEHIYKKMDKYNLRGIQDTSKHFKWKEIIENKLIVALKKCAI